MRVQTREKEIKSTTTAEVAKTLLEIESIDCNKLDTNIKMK